MMPAAAVLRRLLVMTLLLCASAMPSHGQSDANSGPAKLVIGTMRVPPFVLRSDDGRWSGLSIEL